MTRIEILLITLNKDILFIKLFIIKSERWEAENDQLQLVTKSGLNIILIGIRRAELWNLREMGSNQYYQKNNNKTITKINRN